MVIDEVHDTISYFPPDQDSDRRESLEITQQMQNEFKDVFNGIGCLNRMFSLQLKPGSKPYQMLPRCGAYTLQMPYKEELEWLQKQDIIAPLGVDETAEWCNSLVLVPKTKGKVKLYLDPARQNQALIRPMHRGPTLNDILPKLKNAWYLSHIDVSSSYHSMKLDE